MTEPRDPIERIEAALSRLGEEHEPPAGWEARVLAAAAPPRKRPWWLFAAGPVLAAAAVIAILVVPRKPPPAFMVAVDVRKGPVVVRGDSAGSERAEQRETTAHLGDTVVARASAGAGHRALWIYHDEHDLVLACPGSPQCKTSDDELLADFLIKGIGTYQVVGVSSTAALGAPTGNYDQDVAEAERVNALVSQYKVTVR